MHVEEKEDPGDKMILSVDLGDLQSKLLETLIH